MTVIPRFRYKCTSCDEVHTGFPAVHYDEPSYYSDVPENERGIRCQKNEDFCVVDETYFYVRCCLEYPILGTHEVMSWGVWGSLSRESFIAYQKYLAAGCDHPIGPFFSWLANRLPSDEYPVDEQVACEMQISLKSQRPKLAVLSSDHPLYIEQQNGIPMAKALRIVAPMVTWHSASG